MENKIIQGIDISLETIAKSGENRVFRINGDKGSSFMLQVTRSDGQFYDFKTRTFSSGFGVKNTLKAKMPSNVYNGKISFPSIVSDETYNILLFADPTTDTSLVTPGGVMNKSISQVADTTITFGLTTTNADNYTASPPAANKTSQGSSAKKHLEKFDTNWTVTNTASDAYGFGLRLIRQPLESDWVFRKEQTVNGTISSATSVVLNDITDLVVGMQITGVSSGSLSGTPSIKSIDTKTKTLVFSTAQSFAHGITLTFDAIGFKSIYKATGAVLKFDTISATASKLSKTVRTAVSNSTTINLDGTYGIAGGNVVSISGVGYDNNSSAKVTSISASSTTGSIVVQANQTLSEDTTLHFKGSARSIDVAGRLTIVQYPTSDRTINLLLDNFITPGAAS